jgi:FAD dependent oxidoreductase TIGR03364
MLPVDARRSTLDADLCVVGAGIVGLAHAFEARRRGLRVVVIDRDAHAVGASVRNFGHVFVAAAGDGEALDSALLARERWLELGRLAGLSVQQAGSLVIARAADELEVLESATRDERRGARILSAQAAGELAPIPTHELVGALHGTLDLRVDPRSAVGALAALLTQDERATVVWNSRVHAVEPGVVHSTRSEVRAPLVVVCPGPEHATLPAELSAGLEAMTRCKLQMLRIAAPQGRRFAPALVTGLSLIRYPGFSSQPAAARLRARIADERPELVAAGIHLLVTQLPDGDLIVGDTHEYADTVSPFGDERLDELLLGEARRLLGAEALCVLQRWHGIYPSADGRPFLVTAPLPGVRVVEVVSGLGMTTAFGLAPSVLDELLEPAPALSSP